MTSMQGPALFVTSMGMACPVGLCVASACAAKRAGLSALQELPFLDNACEPIIGATVPSVGLALPASTRMSELLMHALVELIHSAPKLDWKAVPFLLCLAEPERPGIDIRDIAQTVIQDVSSRLGIRFDPNHSKIIPSGHVAGMHALHEASRLMQETRAPACVVAGVDSLLSASTLQWLDNHRRLKTSTHNDGLFPGEGAAAILVQAYRQSGTCLAISGLGFGQEEAPLLSNKPLRAGGLTDAARTALAQAKLGLHEIDWRLSDVTGEQYGFKELPLMEARLFRTVRKEDQPLWHWAEAMGDTGAIAAIVQLILAEQAFRKGYAPGTTAICLSSALAGARAAAVVRDLSRSEGGL
ncbi:beta-ketoacyl synthase N-terminal-like domain-containing protein [Pseudomonas thivervalensis]|uniref:beta-ketoacyl synthase N-terminal-like domain-containing protein n=1 Tax=Pseudomonas thivervalensis TaxID=86265 RepID=UPI003D6C4015